MELSEDQIRKMSEVFNLLIDHSYLRFENSNPKIQFLKSVVEYAIYTKHTNFYNYSQRCMPAIVYALYGIVSYGLFNTCKKFNIYNKTLYRSSQILINRDLFLREGDDPEYVSIIMNLDYLYKLEFGIDVIPFQISPGSLALLKLCTPNDVHPLLDVIYT